MYKGMSKVEESMRWSASGRENRVRDVFEIDLKVKSLTDCRPIPHNGCKTPKRRRV